MDYNFMTILKRSTCEIKNRFTSFDEAFDYAVKNTNLYNYALVLEKNITTKKWFKRAKLLPSENS